jgi:hypothetical protein
MEFFTATGKIIFFFFLEISSDYAEIWPEPVQRHLQRLMGDHLISACTYLLTYSMEQSPS